MNRLKIAVLTGAGISAESGIPTFRDAGGLWEGFDVMDVASPQGWAKDPQLVLKFYNERRQGIRNAQPNPAHKALAELESKYNVVIITQNIDDLHERGGSSRVLHLHGEIFKARSVTNTELIYDLGDKNIEWGDTAEDGGQLRPHIVWFGEDVPMMERAAFEASEADILIIVGTSMVVYPAAGLINYARYDVPVIFIDPVIPDGVRHPRLTTIAKKASVGVTEVVQQLLATA